MTEGLNAWSRTLSSANEMTAELRADGWEVVTVRAGHVAPEPPERGEPDRFGYVYLAQGDVASEFERIFDAGSFGEYEVFAHRDGNDLFLLTRITDPERHFAILLVGGVNLSHAGDLVTAARERGEMYSHVVLLDGTHLGSFHHDDPTLFLPEER